MKLTDLREAVSELRSSIEALAELDDITAEQDQLLDELLAEHEERSTELAAAEERDAKIAAVRSAEVAVAPGYDNAPQIMRRVETDLDVRNATRGELRDAGLKRLETEGRDLKSFQLDKAEGLVRASGLNLDGSSIAKRLLLTETPAYRSAFMKGICSPTPAFTPEEAHALNEYRAMSIGTDSAGGFGVPVLIDPSIIPTGGGTVAPLLDIARVETITTDEWKGVSSDGVTWSFDAEAAEVGDDAPTLAQPTVPVHKAQGFIPFSIEVGQDYPAFADEIGRLVERGYMDLIAEMTITGSGTNQPTGIFTALDANTNVEVVVATDGAFAVADVRSVWKELPERARGRATWLMHTDVANEIDGFGSNDANFTTTLAEANVRQIKGRPVVLTDHAPEFTGTLGAANILVVGDFESYLIALRAGMTVELVNHLFATGNNRPSGQRGLYAYARMGADSVADDSFRLLQNQ